MKIEPERLKAFLLDGELASKGKITEADLTKLQAYILGIPFVNLEHDKLPDDVLAIIPEPIARTHNIIAYKKDNDSLDVAMLDPENLETIEFIKKTSNLKILPRLTDRASIKHALAQYRKSLEAEFGEIIKKETGEAVKIVESKDIADLGEEDLKKIAEDLPIVKIADTLLKHAIAQRASDIHVEPQEKEVVVRYRIDGILHDAMFLPSQVAPGIIARIKVLANLKLDEHRLPQDGRFKIETDTDRVSFRVSILPVYGG